MSILKIHELGEEVKKIDASLAANMQQIVSATDEDARMKVIDEGTELNHKRERVMNEISAMLPMATLEINILLSGTLELSEDDVAVQKALGAKSPFAAAMKENVLGAKKGASEQEVRALQDILKELNDIDGVVPELGRAILTIFANTRSKVTAATTPVDSSRFSPGARRALTLVDGGAQRAMATIGRSSSASVASDLMELQETQPLIVRKFLKTLQPDARTELFTAGLSLDKTGSLFLFPAATVATQINKLYRRHVRNKETDVYALSVLGQLVSEADEAMGSESAERLAHILKVFAYLGTKDVEEIMNFDYEETAGLGGDAENAEENLEAVRTFVSAYATEINEIAEQIRLKLQRKRARALLKEEEGDDRTVQGIAAQAAAQAIANRATQSVGEAAPAFERVVVED